MTLAVWVQAWHPSDLVTIFNPTHNKAPRYLEKTSQTILCAL